MTNHSKEFPPPPAALGHADVPDDFAPHRVVLCDADNATAWTTVIVRILMCRQPGEQGALTADIGVRGAVLALATGVADAGPPMPRVTAYTLYAPRGFDPVATLMASAVAPSLASAARTTLRAYRLASWSLASLRFVATDHTARLDEFRVATVASARDLAPVTARITDGEQPTVIFTAGPTGPWSTWVHPAASAPAMTTHRPVVGSVAAIVRTKGG